LQHTNIVPLYSLHQQGPLQAVCMPYFGSITLADISRDLEGRASLPISGDHLVSTLQNRKSTVRSITASSIARSFAAGQPGPAAARIGGTLPYMAPEHLEAFRDKKNLPDARSDIYSLGLILYELLAGRHAYPSPAGSIRDVLPKLIENRRQPVPPLRPLNP